MAPIKLVQNDTRPIVTLTLTDDSTGSPIDLSALSTTVTVKFRKAGSATLLATIPTNKVNSGLTGQVSFQFGAGVLNVAAGAYEGEINVNFNGDVQTVFDLMRFIVRASF